MPYFSDPSPLNELKCYALFIAAVLGLTWAWTVFYVIPHDNVNQEIAFCQLEIGDRTIEGYEYCFNTLKPSNK